MSTKKFFALAALATLTAATGCGKGDPREDPETLQGAAVVQSRIETRSMSIDQKVDTLLDRTAVPQGMGSLGSNAALLGGMNAKMEQILAKLGNTGNPDPTTHAAAPPELAAMKTGTWTCRSMSNGSWNTPSNVSCVDNPIPDGKGELVSTLNCGAGTVMAYWEDVLYFPAGFEKIVVAKEARTGPRSMVYCDRN